MHRIDSATARANQNGANKTGFHDNADLPNQDATYFTPAWSNSVQEELANVIEGLGVTLDKDNNAQLLQVLTTHFAEKQALVATNSTMLQRFLQYESRISALENRTFDDTQIGELFWTNKHFATASEVSIYKGYGSWKRAMQGRVAVGFSDIQSDPIEYRTHGEEYGSFEHTLTIDEMPEHKHSKGDVFNKFVAMGEDVQGGTVSGPMDDIQSSTEIKVGQFTTNETLKMEEKKVGSNTAHPNQPPSKTIDCWVRIA